MNAIDLKSLHPSIAAELLKPAPTVLFLPNNYLPAHIAAARIFKCMGEAGELYRFRDIALELNANNRFSKVCPTAFRSRLGRNGRMVREFKHFTNIGFGAVEKLCSQSIAKLLLSTQEINLLPEIELSSLGCPIPGFPLTAKRHGWYLAKTGVFVTDHIQFS